MGPGRGQKELYQEIAETHWKEWNAKIDLLLQRVRGAKADRDFAIRRDLAELQRRQYVLTALLGDLQRAGRKNWEGTKDDLEAMFESVRRAYDRLAARYQERTAGMTSGARRA
ncbi:MAG: hypothetical protein KY455_03520 [Euryarchaeota archaeon]|nr:hypothetical protein [Euryarchaeota archaeon]